MIGGNIASDHRSKLASCQHPPPSFQTRLLTLMRKGNPMGSEMSKKHAVVIGLSAIKVSVGEKGDYHR